MKDKIKNIFDDVKNSLDVGGKKNFEEELKEDEERFSVLFDNCHDIISIVDEKAKTLWANKAWKQMFGENLDIKNPFDKLHPEDIEKVQNAWMKLIKNNEEIIDLGYRLKGPGGDYLVFETSANKFKIGDKESVLVIAHNITEKNKTEEKLKKEKKFCESIVNTAQTIILVLDKEGTIVNFNPYMEKLTGYKLEEVKGKDWFDTFLPGRYHDKIRNVFKKAIGDIQTKGNINPILTKDGKEILIEWYDNTLKDDEGKIIGLLCVGHDVTKEKKAEKALKKSKKKYKKIYEKTPLLNFIVDKEGKFVGVNETVLKVLGYEKKEIIGKSARDYIIDKELGNIAMEKIEASFGMDEKESPDFECDVYKKDGSIMTLLLSKGHTIVKNGKEDLLLMSGIDITERKKAEKEKEKLQERLRKYAKRLEIKIKKLEKDRVRLTNNEKKVLWGITRYPYSSDLALAKKLKLKRSTVTAIRNRLSDKGIYTIKNIPNFKAIGAGLFTVAFGKFNKSFDKFKTILEEKIYNVKNIHTFSTKNEFMVMVVSKNMADFEKQILPFKDMLNSKKVLKDVNIIHLFPELSRIYRCIDYSRLFRKVFDIKIKQEPKKNIKTPDRKLNKNEKRVLLAMIEYPGLSAYDISFKVNLTRVTVSKIKKKLIKEGFVRTKIIPDFAKLGLNFLTLMHTKHSPSFKGEMIDSMLKKNPHSIFFAGGSREAIAMSVFRNYDECKQLEKKATHEEKGMFLESPSVFYSTAKEVKVNRLNFLKPTKELLE
ncbi:PAS domain S-box protein [Candidatus Woesearchaeota archaeon]|nr:PAS domain S-box protein [Candidatus Woesearchaeota archaeon]